MTPEPVILLIEDDEDDAFLARRILKKAGLTRIHHLLDGQAALDYLAGRGAYADRALQPLPTVMLVDLKIPHVNGHQVVEWAAAQPHLKSVRIFILSSSGEERDRQRARDVGAHGYLVKPLTVSDIPRLLGEE